LIPLTGRWLGILALLILLAGCAAESVTYRYRLTVEVQTPEGLKTGSSVIEVHSSLSGPLHPGIDSSVRGEAVAVDLGARGILFALLFSRSDHRAADGIAPATLQPGYVSEHASIEGYLEQMRELKKVEGRADVPAASYPMLVRFRDPKSPLTVEEVSPNNLGQAFGQGVRIVRMTAEISNEPFHSILEMSCLG
jgi:hypothetical protein